MIVIATCNQYPQIFLGLKLIVDALTRKGEEVRCIPWQEEDLSVFCQAKYVLPLCAWDYAKTPEDFKDWLMKVKNGGGKLLNSPDIILKNMNKTYLLELANKGVNVTPSCFLKKPSLDKVESIKLSHHWDDMVLKPVYGQSGNLVTRYSNAITNQDEVFKSDGGILVQPFIPEIKSNGELAICFINGIYSHSVGRMPASDDWRANTKYKVSVKPIDLDEKVIEQARSSLSYLDEMPLYARVDGIIVNENFMLSELELIEPALFFELVEDINQTGFDRLISHLAG